MLISETTRLDTDRANVEYRDFNDQGLDCFALIQGKKLPDGFLDRLFGPVHAFIMIQTTEPTPVAAAMISSTMKTGLGLN